MGVSRSDLDRRRVEGAATRVTGSTGTATRGVAPWGPVPSDGNETRESIVGVSLVSLAVNQQQQILFLNSYISVHAISMGAQKSANY
jgi:hypothetical protein